MYGVAIEGTADYDFWGELKYFRITEESEESFEDAEARARNKAARLYGANNEDIRSVTYKWEEPMNA